MIDKIKKIIDDLDADKPVLYFTLAAVLLFIITPKEGFRVQDFILMAFLYFFLLTIMLLFLHRKRHKDSE